jgi:nucleoside-diphosphate-sugar epimerase
MNILVTGSSGQIGGHLCKKLENEGHVVIGVDIESPKFYKPKIFKKVDCRIQEDVAYTFIEECKIDIVYMLSAKMGGMGIIGDKKWSYEIMVGSTQQLANVLDNCIKCKVKKMFWASSACAYPEYLQDKDIDVNLRESDMLPAQPDLIYGWQKVAGEKMCEAANITHGLDVKIARFHNIFATEIDYASERTKAPAALCYKVAKAKEGEFIEVWGDGTARRSFLWIDECLAGVDKLMDSNWNKPINIGSEESISINNLAKMIIDISGKRLLIKNVYGNVGVQSRNSENTLCREVLGWSPTSPLSHGMKKLYSWINKQVNG